MDSLYRRYSSALLSLAINENKVSEYKDSLNDILLIFHHDNDIPKYLESYFVHEDEKFKFIDELTKPYSLTHLSSFLKLLTQRHRIFIFDKIVNDFAIIANEKLGIVEGYVYSVTPLSEEEIDNVKQAISKKLHQKVELKNLIDKSLIGGLKVVIHDHVYDGSIKGKLMNLKSNLNERRELKNEN